MKNHQTLSDLKEYEIIINTIINKGYKCINMDEFDSDKAHLLLRHDVDINFDAAVDMAEIEAKNNWQSIYFIMLSTEFYNIFSRAGRKNLNSILNLDHEIGLHYDLSVYNKKINIEKKLKEECQILETLIDRPVRYVAPHRPSSYCKEILNSESFIANRAHPYQPKYFSDNKYITESPGYWSHGHPLDNTNFKTGKAIQLLTHPHLWVKEEKDRDIKIQFSIEQQKKLLLKEAELNFNGFKVVSNHHLDDK